MKKTIISILFLSSSFAYAQSTLPQVKQPLELTQGVFAEGTNTRLTIQEIEGFLPWSQSAKKVLSEALLQAKRMPLRERSHFIRGEVEKVVLHSGSKRYQTLMRYALNRGLLLVNELEKESDQNVQGTIENQLDILSRTIKTSLRFYESDLDYQKRIESGFSAVEIDNARFGFALAKELYAANMNIFDASAQYRNLYKTLEMLNWDLTQDRYARNYSEVIWDIYNNLERMSEVPTRDDLQTVENTRKLNLLKEKAFSALDEIAQKDS